MFHRGFILAWAAQVFQGYMEKIQFIKLDTPQLAVYLTKMFVFVLSA